ncbi:MULTISPECIES: gephyrin-like molybdotransferase Glp [Priestia]|uniref:Molybdopterin molybdenumtransferase n=2 Tax=Priestia TaxID=2800373 RepID=A0AAX6BNE0_PRIMG|nr:gephyrin-like molybdotransferase Glp [Priestia megaterium]AWD63622.1 molybdopterin molybdenumtransferase [Priestia megaterium]MEB4884126.1 molybdopterin molybdotransferase MoeA [Priestia megaterium]MED5116896.1 molybdopterin molybdotransferase MoeA [Priestia megaterium]QFY74422.1 molybdopterin molybdenumtransferase [Priestia megaterium]GMG75265.1 molybdopterin molybdotransferase MoeA [Priestia megaterium]
MLESRTPISIPEAIEKVMTYKRKGSIERVSITESYGRYLGEDIIADQNVPHFNKSLYDGFAVRAQDCVEVSNEHSVEFEVVGEIGAGSVFEEELKPFQAVRIMTGAQVPHSCDAVVMLEVTKSYEKEGKTYMALSRRASKWEHIALKGEETKKGDVLVSKGTRINPGVTAFLATFGYADVAVVKQPIVGVLTTGSELLDVNEPLEPGKIRNSNSYMALAQIVRSGGIPKYLGKLEDDFDRCYEAVEKALEEVDILLTTGGVSVGDYDYLPAIYKKLGANVLFNKIAMRPGSVTTVAERNGQLLFGLSGNPSACYVGFELFVRPIVRSFLHSPAPHLHKTKAVLNGRFKEPNAFTRMVRGKITDEGGRLLVTPVGMDKSGAISSLAAANGLIVLPGGEHGYDRGIEVDVLHLEKEGTSSLWV